MFSNLIDNHFFEPKTLVGMYFRFIASEIFTLTLTDVLWIECEEWQVTLYR